MKLASLREGRDGALVVVDRALSRALRVPAIAPTLQAALDDWDYVEGALREAAARLEAGSAPEAFALDLGALAAPLPRAYAFLDASAYVHHVELVRRARGAELPARFWSDPLMYQGGSDRFLGPREPILLADVAFGLDFEAEVAVITGDVPMGCAAAEAGRAIRLLTLLNDVSLRHLIPDELAKGFGFVQGKPQSALGAVAVTPDELGAAFADYKVCLPLSCELNGQRFGDPHAGVDMTFDFATLIAHAARTRPLGAGTVLGSGTVSNRDRARGNACIVERRTLELLDEGRARTPFLQPGDRVRIEMRDALGQSVFGALDQDVVLATP